MKVLTQKILGKKKKRYGPKGGQAAYRKVRTVTKAENRQLEGEKKAQIGNPYSK